MTPPRWADSILRSLLATRDRDSIPDDLAEAYEDRLRRGLRADLWYLRQVISVAWHVAPRSPRYNSASLGILLGLLMAVGVLLTNVLFPMLHVTLAENDVAEVAPWALVALVIAGAGWSQRRNGFLSAMRAGGTVAFLGFGIVMLTFLLVDNVFLDVVSRQPEKQWLLKESGYQSMRVAVTVAQLRALVTVLPILSLLGGIIGGIAGMIGKLRTRWSKFIL